MNERRWIIAVLKLGCSELAHQWFGDLVVIKHWSHAWIKEGMASYPKWTESEYGAEGSLLPLEKRNYITEDSSRYRRLLPTYIEKRSNCMIATCMKKVLVFMIRAELGDELFWHAIHTLFKIMPINCRTIDLRAIERATGRNLLFLFDQYVYRGGHPDFKVAYSWDGDSKLAKVTVTQTQSKETTTAVAVII